MSCWNGMVCGMAKTTAGIITLGCLLALPVMGQAPTQPDPPKPDSPKQQDAKKASPAPAPAKQDPKGKKAGPAPAIEAPADPNNQPEYKVGVGDSLSINVWKEPEVSGGVQIRGDCRITLPLIKEVEVCGMTPTEIQDLLVDRLSKFIAAPDVTVVLNVLNSRKVYFIGNVRRPGGMVLNGPITIAQALSDAGGLADFANDKKVVIMRPNNGKQDQYIFNYRNYLHGRSMEGNILLQPGDTVIVK